MALVSFFNQNEFNNFNIIKDILISRVNGIYLWKCSDFDSEYIEDTLELDKRILVKPTLIKCFISDEKFNCLIKDIDLIQEQFKSMSAFDKMIFSSEINIQYIPISEKVDSDGRREMFFKQQSIMSHSSERKFRYFNQRSHCVNYYNKNIMKLIEMTDSSIKYLHRTKHKDRKKHLKKLDKRLELLKKSFYETDYLLEILTK